MSSFASRILFNRGFVGIKGNTFSIRNINNIYSMRGLAITPNLVTKKKSESIELIPKRLSSSHGDHVKLWTAEKAISAALLPIIPVSFMFTTPVMDYLLAFVLTIHSHWGIEAIVVDYIRPSVFGEFIPKIAMGLVYALSALTLGGLWYFTYSDVGLINAIKMLWKI